MSQIETSNAKLICPVFESSAKCEERDIQGIMEKFKDFYENKLNEIDAVGNGDSLEMKLKVQQRWIEDLTEQTQMMARFVRELEDEATNRVQMLEDKLKQTSKSAYEVMRRYQTYSIENNLDEPFQKIFYLESDLKNVLEFIKRVRDDSNWNIDGLHFYDVSYKDLFGREQCKCDDKERDEDSTLGIYSSPASDKKETTFGFNSNDVQGLLQDQLKNKIEEYENLKQTMLDMRHALTEEVACKHDMISALKKDVQQLEDRCVQADKQTAFKDDIIKELRKEIKYLKKDNKDIEETLTKQLEEIRAKMLLMKPLVEVKTASTTVDDEFKVFRLMTEEKELDEEIIRRQYEVIDLKCKCDELEKALKNSQDRAENLQNAVDLYSNSVNVLQASEERARIESEQQRTTIANLQEALVSVKQELDECRQSSQQEVSVGWATRWFGSSATSFKPNKKSVHDI